MVTHDMAPSPPNKNATHESSNTRSTMTSPLFRLPPELRNKIYYYVLGGQTIHIGRRACYANEPRILPVTGAEQAPNFEGASRRFVKTTYAVCNRPHVDLLAYEASKRDESEVPKECFDDEGDIMRDPDSPHTVSSYEDLHESCLDALKDFAHQAYVAGEVERHDCDEIMSSESDDSEPDDSASDELCKHCRADREDMNRVLGPPRLGLPRYHADSSLDLNLLKTCRQIHNEAALLPYSMNNFAFEHWEDALLLGGHTLTRKQSRAIQSVHLFCVMRMEWVGHILDCLKGVRSLHMWYYMVSYRNTRPVNHEFDLYGRMELRRRRPLATTVRAIIGEDCQWWDDNPHPKRAERRRQAEQIEKVFTAKIPKRLRKNKNNRGWEWPDTRAEWERRIQVLLGSSEGENSQAVLISQD